MVVIGHRVFGHVPAWLGGHLHRLPTSMTFGITGPFNGQKRRVEAVSATFGGGAVHDGHRDRHRTGR